MIKKKIKLVRSFFEKKQINILDYGCGTGDFLVESKKRNCLGIGVEPDVRARNLALKKGVRIVTGIKNTEKFPTNTFDVITLWHSLEHVHDIKDTITKLSNLLRKDGIMVIAAPEHKSFDAKVYKKYWAAYDLPRHLYHFDEKTLNKCLPENDFKLCLKKGLIFDSHYVSILSEKHKNRNTFFALIFGSIIGIFSNISAKLKKTPYSSQIYVYRKLA